MTRRLAWAAGASCGLIVGYLYGTVTLDWLSWRAVRRSQPRRAVPGTERRPEPEAALTAAIPAQRTDEPCPITLGPLTCPFRGPHTSHAFQSGTWAPDRKDDADERIE